MKPTSSIFNRNFKLLFNQNKYMNLTGTGHTPSQLNWVSPTDYRLGRAMMYFLVTTATVAAYLDPAWFHETFGHFKQPPKYIAGFGKGLESQEKKLNKQILERHEAEEKLEHFKHEILAFDGK